MEAEVFLILRNIIYIEVNHLCVGMSQQSVYFFLSKNLQFLRKNLYESGRAQMQTNWVNQRKAGKINNCKKALISSPTQIQNAKPKMNIPVKKGSVLCRKYQGVHTEPFLPKFLRELYVMFKICCRRSCTAICCYHFRNENRPYRDVILNLTFFFSTDYETKEPSNIYFLLLRVCMDLLNTCT